MIDCSTNQEERIVLMNGTELVCYPKKEKEIVQPNEVDACKFFMENAFLIYQNADRILSDSRMFLAPVWASKGLTSVENGAFSYATLGVYVEWWLNCVANTTRDILGRDAVLVSFWGNPMTGTASGRYVYPDGSQKTELIKQFSDFWEDFRYVNARYAASKAKYDAYTLEEVVEMLKGVEISKERAMRIMLLREEGLKNAYIRKFENMSEKYDEMASKCRELSSKNDELTIMLHREVLEAFRAEYMKRKQRADLLTEVLMERKKVFRNRLKSHEINQDEYRRLLVPLKERIDEERRALDYYRCEKTKELGDAEGIASRVIDKYLE